MAHSRVSERRGGAGRVVIAATTAQRTASAPRPASGGPFLMRGAVPWPGHARQVEKHARRVVRSASVA